MAPSKEVGSRKQSFHPSTEFRIESPTGKFKSFRIRHKSPDTRSKWTIIKTPEIDLANSHLKSGPVSPEHTKEKLKVILEELYQQRDATKKKPEFMSRNIELVKKMWEEKYTSRRKREMKRPQESFNDLMRAAESVGMLPLDTTPLETLEDHLYDTLSDNPEKLRRRIIWVNSILVWLGRPTIAMPNRRIRQTVTYLSEAEFKQIVPFLKNHSWDKTLARIAFYTGMRLGEIFAIQSSNVKGRYLTVHTPLCQGSCRIEI